MSRLSFAVISALFFLLQGSFLPFISGGTAEPDLWLVASVISLIVYDKRTALLFAALGGVLTDIVIGNFFGLHLFPYLVTTLVTAAFIRAKYHRRLFVSLYYTATASCLYIFVMWCVIWFSGAHVSVLDYVLYRAWKIIGLNIIAAVFIHHLFWSVKKEWVSKW